MRSSKPAPARGSFGLDPAASRADALARIARGLAGAGIGEAASDARILVTEALGITRLQLLNEGAEPLGEAGADRLAAAAARRLAREPLARIAGYAAFRGLDFALSPATLVPRADSEAVVRAALAVVPEDASARILDLGTGTGCLLLSILHERPAAWGVAVDSARGALQTARANARALGLAGRAAFLRANWSAALAGPFDLVVSNPPYIASATIPNLEPEVARHDPRLALDGGPDGLAAYRIILPEARRLLAPGGHLVLEVGFDQAGAVTVLGRQAGLGKPRQARDLGHHVRALTFAA